MSVVDCPVCLDHFLDTPVLAAAAASVGIEYGRSTDRMLREYFVAYHRRRHSAG